MNTTELYDLLLPIIQENPIRIDLSIFDSPDMDALSPYFQGEEIVLNEPNTSGFSETNMSFSGIGGSLPFPALDLQIRFYVAANVAQVEFLATGIAEGEAGNTDGTSNFSLTKCFPPLADSVLDEISYGQTSSFSLTSLASEDYPLGFDLDGSMTLDGALSPLALLFGSSQQALTGQVSMVEGLPVADLIGPLNTNLPFDFLDALPQINLSVKATSAYNQADEAYISSGGFGISTDLSFSLPFGESTTVYEIPMETYLGRASNKLVFYAYPDALIQAGLDAFAYFVDGSSLGEALTGALFGINNFLQLSKVSLTADLSESLSISSSTLSVNNRSEWVFLRHSDGSPMLSIDEFEVSFKYSSGAGVPVSAQISGDIPLTPTASLHLNTSIPDFNFYLGIDDEDVLLLPELFGVFFDLNGVDLPELTIEQFWLTGNPGEGSFAGELQLQGDWNLPPVELGLAIGNIHFEMGREEGDQYPTADLKAEFAIGEVSLELEAAYPEPGAGWNLSGSTPPGQDIPLGQFIQNLASSFGTITLPAPLVGLTLKNLAVDYNTNTQNYHLSGEADFPLGDGQVQLIVKIDHEQLSSGAYETIFRGTFIFAKVDEANPQNSFNLEFDVIFDDDPNTDSFLAVYSNTNGSVVTVRDLVGLLVTDTTILNAIPEGLSLELYDALFGVMSNSSTTRFLFGLDWGLGVDLTNLPLVGKLFPPDETLQMAYQVLFPYGGDFTVGDVEHLNSLLPPNTISLPDQALVADTLVLSSTMRLGEFTEQLDLPVEVDSTGNLSQTNTPSPEASNIHWFDIQKTFGPVYFNRVGLGLIDEEIWFSLDADLSSAGLSLSLDGLAISTPLTSFSPSFHLNGLGIDFNEGGVEIGGALLAQDGIYSGMATLKVEEFGLSVMGSYTDLGGDPSMFLYGFLGVPLGGPPFLFVTGLSAGAGYNRSLQMPPLSEIDQFPFVSEAIAGTGNPSLTDELNELNQYISPETGVYWLAAGIRVTSFKLLDTFVMATVEVGKKLEVNLVGMSSLMFPPEPGIVRPLAELQLAVLATIDPLEGFMGVSAELTENSYILDPGLKLTGGFALYTWLFGEHGGDFVLSLGGYHPEFKVPAHYPVVPRLGFDWKVDHHLSFKGGTYLALTPGYLMAGIALNASWDSGDLKAWFDANMDFILGFKPFTYDSHAQVDVGASYTFDEWGLRKTFSYEVGADLHIWGPDVAGKAEIDLGIISFEVGFGADQPLEITAIDWTEFSNSFLPEAGATLNFRVSEGLSQTLDSGEAVVRPEGMEILLKSAIPITQATYSYYDSGTGTYEEDNVSVPAINTSIGIAPMDTGNLSSNLVLTVTRNGVSQQNPFSLEPVFESVPAGLWGTNMDKSLDSPLMVSHVLTGFRLRPLDSGSHSSTKAISASTLAFEETVISSAFGWETDHQWNLISSESNIGSINQNLLDPVASSTRSSLLNNLNVNWPVDVTDTLADEFWTAPLIIQSES